MKASNYGMGVMKTDIKELRLIMGTCVEASVKVRVDDRSLPACKRSSWQSRKASGYTRIAAYTQHFEELGCWKYSKR